MPKRKVSESAGIDVQRQAKAADEGHEKEQTREKLINDANRLSVTDFKALYFNDGMLQYSIGGHKPVETLEIEFRSSSDMSEDELNACFDLIESTSRQDYQASSWGWHPKRKMKEMREAEMRYLLVYASTQTGLDRAVEGFISFMLTHDSTPAVPVLYVYEIHLSEFVRNVRLGTHLMKVVEDVAEKVGVSKVMLTCFVSNESAHGFYERRGYVKDVCSPEDRTTRGKTIKTDHVIMSKLVPKQHSEVD